MKRLVLRPSVRGQRGVYAIEFSIVFIFLFTMLYALICYGILFTLRFSLQNAAEDGARAALRYQTSWADRKKEAERVALAQVPVKLSGGPSILAQRCQVLPSGETDCSGTVTCTSSWEQRCQVVVTVKATGIASLLPPLPLFVVPDTLVGQASMLLDGGLP